ncbi:MAG TPA: MBL fold metallo-hydrolase [Terriglobales bacterium]|nr:MBL fold metallo-hydrolase [Terriglobales bacterium]
MVSLRRIAVVGLLGVMAAAQTRVVLLGTGSPNPDPDRSGPAAAVVVNGTAYLVDAGPGIVRRAAAAERAGQPALAPTKLTRVFLTHLHSDHTLGYPDLIFSPWVVGRSQPLQAYGPRGLQAMTTAILSAWSEDIAMRTEGLEHANKTGYQVRVREIAPGAIYRDANVTVTAFAVHHGSWPQAFGYAFQTRDRRIVFSGDTAPVAAVAQACHGCDLLFHEVYNPEGKFPPAWRTYLRSFHTSSSELGAIAAAAHPKLLVLYHQLFEGEPPEELLQQVRQHYAGAVVSGRDLDVY